MNEALFEACEKCIHEEPAACAARCPVHVDVAALAAEMEKSDFKKAYKILEKRIPFAGIIGMICDHPCEAACVRGGLDQPVNVSELERAAVSYGHTPYKKYDILPKKKGKAAVVGGGVSGLTAAFELDKKGFQVTVYEQTRRLGGRIWSYEGERIGREAIEEELQTVGKLGVRVNYDSRIGTEDLNALTKEYDAVYLGTGEWEEALYIHPETFQVLDWPVFAGGRLTGNDSVIHAVSSGKRAAVSMERYIKKISLTASREREGSFVTPLNYNTEDVEPSARIEKTREVYTEAEAVKEAERCLKCRCVECIKACSHLQRFNVSPKSYGNQIRVNENVIMGTRYANKMINSCAMCGLCGEQCPLDIGMRDLVRQTRESMTEKGKMPPSAHDFALKDMEFSNSSQFFMVKPPPTPGNGNTAAAYLFYPGCQLSASSPEYVEKTYRYLLSTIEEGVGLMLGCCGAPADWAGRTDLMRESTERFRTIWTEAGKPAFIFACSSCISIFERYLPEIPHVSLWEIFRRYGLPESAGKKHGHILNVHDACSTRHRSEVHESVRAVAAELGYQIEELKYSGVKTKCCGYGGLVYFSNREQADGFAGDRIKESKADLLVYCSMCKDLFVDQGKRTFHILDLIFAEDPEEAALRKKPNLSRRHENRAGFKIRILRELWGEEPETDLTQRNKLNLVIPPETWETMEKRFILFGNIEEVIAHSRMSGKRFFNPEDSSYLAHLRIKHVTYWVRYAEKEDGIHIMSVYSHRMEVKEDGVNHG
ncbi:MAG TPA: FAD-dependent oxidoreductase [Anaerovoracaceae bacterium]|nr:FAD-dependent oxidoreductase [Anaerovoracaceae bacterium]